MTPTAQILPLPPSRWQVLQTKIGDLFRPDRRWSILEMDMLKHLLAHPTAESEADTIAAYFHSLPAHEKKFFPNSVMSLMEKWEQVLDKAALAHKLAPEPPKVSVGLAMAKFELGRVEERMAHLKKYYGDTTWEQKHREEYRTLQAKKGELLGKLGMII